MIKVLKLLRDGREETDGGHAIAKLLRRPAAQAAFRTEMMEKYNWDGHNLEALIQIILKFAPQIIELILKLVA